MIDSGERYRDGVPPMQVKTAVMATPVIHAVKQAIRQANLTPGDVVVIGLSGGADSQTLTHALTALHQQRTGPEIRAVHVNHQLRPESEHEAERVAKIAHMIGVPVDIVSVNVGEWDRTLRQGVEAAARAARYAALGQLARDLGTPWVAVGHTRDDQAETVLLRLAGGTSLDGISGMRQVSERDVRLYPDRSHRMRLQVIRPLLGVGRRDVERYARHHHLEPIQDPSNVSAAYRRNVVRHQVLPVLDETVPGAAASIARSACILQDDADFIRSLAQKAESGTVAELDGIVMIAREPVQRLHPAIQRRLIASAMIRAAGDRLRLTLDRIEALRSMILDGSVSSRIELGEMIVAYVDYHTVALGAAADVEDALRRASVLPLLEPETSIPLTSPTELRLRNDWLLRAEQRGGGSRWLLRTRRPGDRVAFSSGPPTRLQDWFVNQKIPAYARDRLPLLVDDGVIRWIAGLSPSQFRDEGAGVHVELRREPVETSA
jgi:tRNA(Ile)-lysidine synthetase-like protein